jgi:hypothetical protein
LSMLALDQSGWKTTPNPPLLATTNEETDFCQRNVWVVREAYRVPGPGRAMRRILWHAIDWSLVSFVIGGIPWWAALDAMDSWCFALSNHSSSLGTARMDPPKPQKESLVHSP